MPDAEATGSTRPIEQGDWNMALMPSYSVPSMES
jgi:hypothetical protein